MSRKLIYWDAKRKKGYTREDDHRGFVSLIPIHGGEVQRFSAFFFKKLMFTKQVETLNNPIELEKMINRSNILINGSHE